MKTSLSIFALVLLLGTANTAFAQEANVRELWPGGNDGNRALEQEDEEADVRKLWSGKGGGKKGGGGKKKGGVKMVPEDYDTIQEALDDASPGDTISIGPGIYKESIVINKNYLEVVGRKGLHTVVIDGFGLPPTHGIYVKKVKGVKLQNLVVQGFRQRIGPAPPFNLYRGVFVEESKHCLITKNVFRDNGDGLFLFGSSSNEITHNLAEHNFHDGMFIRDGSSSNKVSHNKVLDNGPDGNRNPPPDNTTVPIDGGCGIQLTNDANKNTVRMNLAARNARGLQIDRGSTGNTLTLNKSFSNTKVGIIVQKFQVFPAPTGNAIIENEAKYNAEFDLWELRDEGEPVGNIWKKNDFGTANFAGTIIP